MHPDRVVLLVCSCNCTQLRAAGESLQGVKLQQVLPDAAVVAATESADLIMVDLRCGSEAERVELGTKIRGVTAAPLIFVSAASVESAERAVVARPEGVLVEPFSNLQFMLAVELALHRVEAMAALKARLTALGNALAHQTEVRSIEPAPRPNGHGATMTQEELVLKGFPSPTRREADVLERFRSGHRVASIAKALFISEGTVRSHLKSVFRKMNVRSQAELMELFIKLENPEAPSAAARWATNSAN